MTATTEFVTTVAHSDQEALLGIMRLYCPLGFDADVTYSRGVLYAGDVPTPAWKSDLAPQDPAIQQADCRALPVPAGSFQSVVVDLPFIHAPGKNSVIGNRFSGYKSQEELRTAYEATMCEMARVIRKDGFPVWKCQDIVESGRQNWTHCHLWAWAGPRGFALEDMIIVVNNERKIVGHNHQRQVHARRTHCYWVVFRKQ